MYKSIEISSTIDSNILNCEYLYKLVHVVVRFGFECFKIIGLYLHNFLIGKKNRLSSYQVCQVNDVMVLEKQ